MYLRLFLSLPVFFRAAQNLAPVFLSTKNNSHFSSKWTTHILPKPTTHTFVKTNKSHFCHNQQLTFFSSPTTHIHYRQNQQLTFRQNQQLTFHQNQPLTFRQNQQPVFPNNQQRIHMICTVVCYRSPLFLALQNLAKLPVFLASALWDVLAGMQFGDLAWGGKSANADGSAPEWLRMSGKVKAKVPGVCFRGCPRWLVGWLVG